MLADWAQARIVKRLAAPEQQLDSTLVLAVANDWVAIQEPNRVAMPNLGLGVGKGRGKLAQQEVADSFGFGLEPFVIGEDICGLIHTENLPEGPLSLVADLE